MNQFDLIIIGGGAGGFAAAIRANELKAKTLMVNTGLPLGGTCVNVGCVPSKTLLWAGEVIHLARNHQIPGIELAFKNFDFAKVIQDELSLVEKLRKEKYEKVLQSLENVTFVEGLAKFVSEKEIEVNGQIFQGGKFILAVGSTANVLPIEGIKEVGYLTHIEALKINQLPKSLLIIGAGPLGLEFAQMYSRFGSRVTILEYNPIIFRPGERALVERLVKILEQEGIQIYTNAKAKKVRKEGEQKVLTVEINGKEKEFFAEEILLAAGKTPNTQKLNLAKAKVEINEKKAIVVNQSLQTSNENIYAVGDCNNLPLRLETTAGHEGTIAVDNALENKNLSIDYQTVPYTIFTDPQLAGVGLTEEQSMKQLGICACRTLDFADLPKAIILRRTEGAIKMMIHPETKQILGVHILAPNAGEIISQAMVLMKNKNTIDDVVHSLPVFPTLSEAIKLVALSFTKDIKKLSCCI